MVAMFRPSGFYPPVFFLLTYCVFILFMFIYFVVIVIEIDVLENCNFYLADTIFKACDCL